MKVTASIFLDVLERIIRKLLFPGFYQKIIILSNILLNSILIYLNKNINNHVYYKSISILVTQKKVMPVLCKRVSSFKPDIIMVAYKLLILYLNIGSPHMAGQKQDNQLEHTFSSYVRIRDVALRSDER